MAKKRETAWVALNSDGQVWSGRGSNKFSNHGKLFKTAPILRSSIQKSILAKGEIERVARVRIEDAIEEEYSLGDFIYEANDLETP